MPEIKIIQFQLFLTLGLFATGLILILILSRKALFFSWNLKRTLALVMMGVGLVYFFQLTNKLVEQNSLNEKNSMLWGQPMAFSQIPNGNYLVEKIIGHKLYVLVDKNRTSKVIVYNDLKNAEQLAVGMELAKNESGVIFIPIKYKM